MQSTGSSSDPSGSPSFPQDANNLAAWEGPCGYDTRHRFVGSFVVELPIARSSKG